VTASTPQHPGWLEISIDIHPVAHEALSAFLFDLGCEGIVSEDLRNRTLKAYWPRRTDQEELRMRIKAFLLDLGDIFPELGPFKLRFRHLKDQDWSRNWRRFFHPDRVTPNLLILPAWEPVPRDVEGRVVRIDPGLAFGTGQHPTTRMCLETMERLPLPRSWSMLDVGTGSGILAIYGARLGAHRIAAIDNDPEALRWAERNIALNDLSGSIALSSMPLEGWRDKFSLVAANLILGTIIELMPFFPPVLEARGWLILSGLLSEQVDRVVPLLAEQGLVKDRVLYQGEWACVIGRKD
jgi:ribosomal protein L11 methyltransferase